MSLLNELMARRVPQIVGLYVAGTWMAIEIGDWLIEKFGLPASITAYIFIGLAALLPAVALMAWGHGAPGADRWSRAEKIVVPINVIAAAAALFFLSPANEQTNATATADNATQTRTLIDETGANQLFEVPVEAFHKNLTIFFLDNQTGDPAYDWVAYGLPLLVAYDLNHETPLVSASTPFNSDTLRESLRIRGFDAAIGEPRSLQVTIAKNNRSDAMISGKLEMRDGVAVAQLQLIDIQSGSVLSNVNVSLDEPLLTIADSVSLETQQQLELDPRSSEENDPLVDNLTANLDAARHYIDARMAVELRNDYPTAIEWLKKATELDSTFAAAHGALGNLHYLSGEPETALDSVDSALRHDYKLSTSRRFLSRAQRYLYSNDFERAIKVLEMWAEVDALNPHAHELLGNVLLVSSQKPDRATTAFEQALALNPTNHKLYSSLASIEQTRGNFAGAAQHIQTYIDARPEDEKAHLQLAMIYTAAEDFDNAREAYLNAELISTSDLGATLGLAKLAIRSGDFEQARERIERVLARTLTPQQQVEALNGLAELQYVLGEMSAMLDTLQRLDDVAARFMPPVLRAVQVGMNVVNTKTLLGDFDGALSTVDALRDELDESMQGFLDMPLLGVYWEMGETVKAMEAFDRAEAFASARADPTYAPVMAYGRVFASVAQSDASAAIEQAELASELMDRSFMMASGSTLALQLRVDMARELRTVGALDSAQELLTRTLRSNPSLPTAHLEMALVRQDLEQLDEARASLDQALAIWKSGDDQYLRLVEARTLLATLDN
ncbi:MAG: tetratricopeptide repeat protein [Gammaproteobacteria bacterium]